jgi:hypothetical protein
MGIAAIALSVLAGPAVAQQIQFACDVNKDGSVDASESRLCTDAEFDRIAPGEATLTEEQLLAKTAAQQGVAPNFSEIDKNGDGRISHSEWGDYSDKSFASATETTGGKMTSEDYATWREKGLLSFRP